MIATIPVIDLEVMTTCIEDLLFPTSSLRSLAINKGIALVTG